MPKTKRTPQVVSRETTYDEMVQPTKELAVRTDHLKLKRKLTLDATSITRLCEVVCQATGELELIEMPGLDQNGQKSKAWAIPILDVVHQTNYLLICNAVIVGALKRAGEPLGGKYFAMRAGEIKAGKRFRHVDVIELELIP